MLYIRTDMNSVIATGHVMRCLAIADAAKEIGENTTFIVSDDQADHMIRKRGYETIILRTRWDNMEMELDRLQSIIHEQRIRALLVDSYQVTQPYLQTLSDWVNVVYIDDLDSFCYPVHTLVCYVNYWENFCHKQKYKQTKLLLGSNYIPLGQPFKNCERKIIKAYAENLLVLSGGTDHFHLLDGFLECINKMRFQRIDVICGMYYQGVRQLESRFGGYSNIHIHQSVDNIVAYMRRADMAVSAGGTTLYELCACGTPTISYSFADNQLNNVRQFQKDGLIDYAGDVRSTDIFGTAARLLDQYYGQASLREERSRNMQKLIDGKGATRIAEEMKELSCPNG